MNPELTVLWVRDFFYGAFSSENRPPPQTGQRNRRVRGWLSSAETTRPFRLYSQVLPQDRHLTIYFTLCAFRLSLQNALISAS